MITCNNIPVFDVQVNRPSTQSRFSYTFDGNKSLTGNNRPYDVRLKGTLIYNVYGQATVATDSDFELSVASSTTAIINEMYVTRTNKNTIDDELREVVTRCDPDNQNTAKFIVPAEVMLKLNSFKVDYYPVVTLDNFTWLDNGVYQIATRDDWINFSLLVNENRNNCSGVTFRQTADINFINSEFRRIGWGANHPFQGTYDGGGRTISGICCNISNDDNVGLFGYIGEGGTVQNVNLYSSEFAGQYDVGGIAGVNHGGTVRNCRVKNVSVTGGWRRAGGIVGRNESGGTVIGCFNNAYLSPNSHYSPTAEYGGIAGFNDATIQDCLFNGTVIEPTGQFGSIVGVNNNGILINNYYNNTIGGVDGSDTDGARRARTVTLNGGDVTLVGNETTYDVSGLTAIGTNALRYTIAENTTTIYSGEGQTINLSYTGNLQAGMAPAFKANNTFIAGNSFTMPARDVIVICAPVLATPVNISGHFSDGVYWSTFCHGILRYALPEGATAYTMDSEKHLYRLGDDGSSIPAGQAVVILSDQENITLTYDSGTTDITDHAPNYANSSPAGGNILRGSNSPVAVSGLGGTPYVLGKVGSAIGFYRYTGTEIPANKAYYVTTP